MAPHTQITRDGKALTVEGGWSWWHLGRLQEAMKEEIGTRNWQDSDAFPSEYKFSFDHTFTDTEENIWFRGAEIGKEYCWQIKAGDIYSCWR